MSRVEKRLPDGLCWRPIGVIGIEPVEQPPGDTVGHCEPREDVSLLRGNARGIETVAAEGAKAEKRQKWGLHSSCCGGLFLTLVDDERLDDARHARLGGCGDLLHLLVAYLDNLAGDA